MPDTAIIPVWRKPAFLQATLKLIEKARGAARLRYLFAIDREADPDVNAVIACFKFLSASSVIRRAHNYPGNSYNILEALKSIAGPGNPDDLVYVIEDDVFVADDFFEFHQDAHRLDEPFFVSACRGPRKILASDAERIVYRSSAYQSLGVSFKAHRLGQIADHATRKYYADMIGYCARELPDAALPLNHAEQSQLIHRVVRKTGGWGLFPVKPRAFHAGFIGYNRGDYAFVSATMLTADSLLALTSDQMNLLADPKYRDIERCELIRSRVSLRLV